MAVRVKVTSIKPLTAVELRFTPLVIKGEEFQSGVVVYVGVLTPVVTYVSSNELRVTLPNTITEGTYNIFVINPDGGRSNNFEFDVVRSDSAVGRYIREEIDMRVQPLESSWKGREYSQRVIAGSDFSGVLPDAAQGTWLALTGPTDGGRWSFAGDVVLTKLEFRTNGAEPAPGRLAGSGFFHQIRGGPEVLIFDLSGSFSTNEYIYSENDKIIKQGDEIILRTNGSTLQQIAILHVRAEHPNRI